MATREQRARVQGRGTILQHAAPMELAALPPLSSQPSESGSGQMFSLLNGREKRGRHAAPTGAWAAHLSMNASHRPTQPSTRCRRALGVSTPAQGWHLGPPGELLSWSLCLFDSLLVYCPCVQSATRPTGLCLLPAHPSLGSSALPPSLTAGCTLKAAGCYLQHRAHFCEPGSALSEV